MIHFAVVSHELIGGLLHFFAFRYLFKKGRNGACYFKLVWLGLPGHVKPCEKSTEGGGGGWGGGRRSSGFRSMKMARVKDESIMSKEKVIMVY